MKKEVILELFGKFEQACYNYQGIEYWSARELQHILGYARWENFHNVVAKAKKACVTAGSKINDHFRDVTKMITAVKGPQREVEEKKLSGTLYKRGVDSGDFALIRSKGDQALLVDLAPTI